MMTMLTPLLFNEYQSSFFNSIGWYDVDNIFLSPPRRRRREIHQKSKLIMSIVNHTILSSRRFSYTCHEQRRSAVVLTRTGIATHIFSARSFELAADDDTTLENCNKKQDAITEELRTLLSILSPCSIVAVISITSKKSFVITS